MAEARGSNERDGVRDEQDGKGRRAVVQDYSKGSI